MIEKGDFGKDFHWGVSTAAYQIEGAHDYDGKGASIWDEFTSRKGKILDRANGNNTCQFYHRYYTDLHLMHKMNIPNFRFSISWSRIFPEGIGKVNKAGVLFYDKVITKCLQLNIQPWITLYHWDLPLALQKKGGWTNRDIIHWFQEFVAFCISTYGDRVKHWMILNEPTVFTGAGYFLGVHAPGLKGLGNLLPAVHHAALCQAEGARVARSIQPDLKIGTTFSCSHVEPYSTRPKDIIAAQRVDTLLNRTFIEPLLGMGYPINDLPLLNRLDMFIKDGDEKKLQFDMDFIGIQNYTREIARHSFFTPLINAKIIKADKRKVEKTEMNWEVYPPSIYHILKKFSSYPKIKELIVTENGAAFPDKPEGISVHDTKRKEYLQNYLKEVLKAKQEGVKVKGYFVWSFMDNFEWAEGFHPRFGLVYIDYNSQKRIIKDSGKWFAGFLKDPVSGKVKIKEDIK